MFCILQSIYVQDWALEMSSDDMSYVKGCLNEDLHLSYKTGDIHIYKIVINVANMGNRKLVQLESRSS